MWRARWDWSILITSWVLALLWGVAFGNIVRGVPLDADHEYVGSFLDLLNPFALLMGLTTLLLFLTHGAVYLALKTTQEVRGPGPDARGAAGPGRAGRDGGRRGLAAVPPGQRWIASCSVRSRSSRCWWPSC